MCGSKKHKHRVSTHEHINYTSNLTLCHTHPPHYWPNQEQEKNGIWRRGRGGGRRHLLSTGTGNRPHSVHSRGGRRCEGGVGGTPKAPVATDDEEEGENGQRLAAPLRRTDRGADAHLRGGAVGRQRSRGSDPNPERGRAPQACPLLFPPPDHVLGRKCSARRAATKFLRQRRSKGRGRRRRG